MRLLIAGSRGLQPSTEDFEAAEDLLLHDPDAVEAIISGGARGVDQAGENYAAMYAIEVDKYVPDWDGLGKKAGMVRNRDMVAACDAALVFWDGVSKGTLDTIKLLLASGKPFVVVSYGGGS